MRGAFVRTLVELAVKDPRILLLTGDIGYMALEPFAEKFPDRFFNVGVAEQNMVGLATGLAEAGFIPFVYSIATFVSLRPYEFIRNGPALHRLPVRMAGVGGGFEYGHNGITHHALEDVAVMRTQPGISVVAPADHEQTGAALRATWDLPGPVYYRLGKDDRTVVPGLNGRFERGRVQRIGGGEDLLIIALGGVAKEAAAAAEILREKGIAATVAVAADINPAPADDIAALAGDFKTVMTVEAHYISGGLGSLVAEIIAERGLSCKLTRCGVRLQPDGSSGSQEYLHRLHGLDRASLAETAFRLVDAGG
ncbi:MAG: 1-deoxy-D-xylulose-5-phosphate synthase [Elusimicrobia bacterium GWA2_56_46]|nr:MAG: 1-deoxy-D-xylulose-5-phosphate synthase [Elusimicrobia bacterium GWA2_56_46]OGR54526.1 MAG: 1-deoxy-D-xylulose-5-phosphate synthase [Elusimicrobia bacterium GWC2_56_31]HBB68197.1 1-deoxy-D-xylulose-5-phosphate synthase [Elusimicrobiota bacterium]HBW22328.1 1-deoxy-D-xylulose-5-phosphate synthase [Elusimicrobiota bacterium]